MKRHILFLAILLSSFSCQAQISLDTPDGILDNFFKIYAKTGLAAAVENIYTYGDESMQQSLKYVKDTIVHTADNMGGKYLGNELITKKSVTPSLVLYSYLVKLPFAPLRLTFVFYKPKDKWMVENFLFDSNTISELIKASRVDSPK